MSEQNKSKEKFLIFMQTNSYNVLVSVLWNLSAFQRSVDIQVPLGVKFAFPFQYAQELRHFCSCLSTIHTIQCILSVQKNQSGQLLSTSFLWRSGEHTITGILANKSWPNAVGLTAFARRRCGLGCSCTVTDSGGRWRTRSVSTSDSTSCIAFQFDCRFTVMMA